MEVFHEFFAAITNGMSIEFTVYGWTFSFMDLFLFSLFAGILASFFGSMMTSVLD